MQIGAQQQVGPQELAQQQQGAQGREAQAEQMADHEARQQEGKQHKLAQAGSRSPVSAPASEGWYEGDPARHDKRYERSSQTAQIEQHQGPPGPRSDH